MDTDEELIDEVRQYSCLYDLTSDLYKNDIHKDLVWAHIGQSLNLDGDRCKKRWKGLRDTYRRVKRAHILASDSAAPVPKKMWRHFDAMAFLDYVQSCRNTVGSIPQPTKTKTPGEFKYIIGSPLVSLSDASSFSSEALSPLLPPENTTQFFTSRTCSTSPVVKPDGNSVKKQIQQDFSSFFTRDVDDRKRVD